MPSIKDVVKKLDTLKLPIAYRSFEQVMDPPFLCYLVPDADFDGADNMILKGEYEISVELYTAQRDFELEDEIINLLSEYGEISMHSDYIKEEELNVTYFDFAITRKLGG